MYNAQVWNGLKGADFTELDARISPTGYRSPRAGDKPPKKTVAQTADRLTGIVRSVKDSGFGFINVDGAKKDVFFHFSKLNADSDLPMVGDTVTFELDEREDKPRAVNVCVTNQ